MKYFCNAFAVLLAAICTASPASALPLVWRADWPDAKPVETLVHRGTDIELQPLWRINKEPADTNGWTFTTFCQTNAVGPWFGPLPGACFSHTNDVGAAFYNVMVRAQTPGGAVNYTAFARLRMLDSPGFTPGELPLPVSTIDFSEVVALHAPWTLQTDFSAAIAVLAQNLATVSNAAVNAAGAVGQLNIGYTRLYNFIVGATNANFTATNYPPTKAEADARCRFEAEPGMDFSKVPASLQLNEYRDGEWRTVVDTRAWPVWYFKFKERQLTNEIARLRAENIALSNKVEAAKSWADRTANGVENPMTDTVVVDRPNLWIMADYKWQKVVSGSNQCFVIRAKNVALSGGGNTSGGLEVVDAFGKPYMRINKSSDTFATPVFDEIYWDQADGAWYVVFSNKTKPTKGGANVALRGNGDGKCILFDENDPECPAVITWPDVPESHSGHWIMKAVPKPINGVVPRSMFFGAEIKVPGSDYVEYLKEASFGAGVRFGDNVYDYVESGDQLILRRRQ